MMGRKMGFRPLVEFGCAGRPAPWPALWAGAPAWFVVLLL